MGIHTSSHWDSWLAPDPDRRLLPEEELSGVRLPRAVPMYGTRTYTPQTTCIDIHPGGPIPAGSKMYCEACASWGCDHILDRLPFVPLTVATTAYDPDDPDDGLKGGKDPKPGKGKGKAGKEC